MSSCNWDRDKAHAALQDQDKRKSLSHIVDVKAPAPNPDRDKYFDPNQRALDVF
jgi:hypothetical protein